MGKLRARIMRAALGPNQSVGAVGRLNIAQGMRKSNDTQIYFGLALTALSYLNRTKRRPRKLIYRQEIKEGQALVIHDRGTGTPKLEISTLKKPRRG